MEQENKKFLIEVSKEVEELKNLFAREDVTNTSIKRFNDLANKSLLKLQKIMVVELDYMSVEELIEYYKVLLLTDNESENIAKFLSKLHIAVCDKDGNEKYFSSMYWLLSGNNVIKQNTYYFAEFKNAELNINELLMRVDNEDNEAKVINKKNEIKEDTISLLRQKLDRNMKYKFISLEEAKQHKYKNL